MDQKQSKTRLILIISILFVGLALFGFKVLAKKGASNVSLPPEHAQTPTPTTLTLHPQQLPIRIESVGRLQAVNDISVISEVPGKVYPGKHPFRLGITFAKDDVMLRVDSQKNRYLLFSKRSQFMNQVTQLVGEMTVDYPHRVAIWEKFLNDLSIQDRLPDLPKVTDKKEVKFLAAMQIYSQYYDIRASEAQLDKYTIRAPFDGVVVDSKVNPGDIVSASTILGRFQSTNAFEVVTFLGLTELSLVQIGQDVTIVSQEIHQTWPGKITRIVPKVEEGAQMATVVAEPLAGDFIDGLIVELTTTSSAKSQVFALPRDYIKDGRIVYIMHNGQIVPKQVQILRHEDKVIIRAFSDSHVNFVKPPSGQK